jgi:outer membrane protein TolC
MRFKLGTDNQIDVGVRVTQTLWHSGRVFSAIRIAKLYKEYTQQGVDEAGLDIKFNVRQAYLATLLARNYVDVYRDALEAARLNYEMVEKMQQQGVRSEYELLRAKVEVSNLEPQMTQAQNQARIAENELKNLIEFNLSDSLALEYDFDSSLVQQPLQLPLLIGIAKERRSVLLQQDLLRDITRRAIGVVDSENSFKFDLESQYGWQYQADNFDIGESNVWSEQWSAGILFTWPIFDGFENKAQVRKAKVDHLQAELTYEQLLDQIEAEIREAYLLYLEAGERLLAQRTTIAEAEEGLRIARLRYNTGVGTQLEVLSAESALTQARNNYVQATHDAALAVYRLVRVAGVEELS